MHRIKSWRTAIVLSLALLFVLATVAPAFAASLSLSSNFVAAGSRQLITVTGTDWDLPDPVIPPNPIKIYVIHPSDRTQLVAKADVLSDGTFSTTFRTKRNWAIGNYTVRAVDFTGRTADAPLTVGTVDIPPDALD